MFTAPGLSVQFLKKEIYTGSHEGMRYLLKSEGDKIKACTYPEPYCFEATKDELKTWEEFPLTPEGLTRAMEWLNQFYEEHSGQYFPLA